MIIMITTKALNNKNFRMNYQLYRLINNYMFYGFYFFENRSYIDNMIVTFDKGSKVHGKGDDNENLMMIIYSQMCFQSMIENLHEFLTKKDYLMI